MGTPDCTVPGLRSRSRPCAIVTSPSGSSASPCSGSLLSTWAASVQAGEVVTGGTTMPLLVPVTDEVTVSVAVIVCVPGVFRVATNEPVPAVRVVLAGSVAAGALVGEAARPPASECLGLLAFRGGTGEPQWTPRRAAAGGPAPA